MTNSTIAAIASPPGMGAVALVRISGPEAAKVVDKVFRGKSHHDWIPRHQHFGAVLDSKGAKVDDVLLTYFPSPASFTGEDVIELGCHGGVVVTKQVLNAVLEAGAEPAEAGEFSQRAFFNGRIDLTQAEAIMDLISAKTELAARAAQEQLEGILGKQIENLREALVSATAHLEAYIDFPEEDIAPDSAAKLFKRFATIEATLKSLLSTADQGKILREGLKTVIAGAPNAGKSSLLNYLAREKVAITSEIPGTTRDLVKASINLGGTVVEFVDTAGVRVNPENKIEEEGILRSKDVIKKSNLTLLVKDSTDQQNFDIEVGACVTIMNKADLLSSYPEEDGNIYFSCITGEGLEGLLNAIMRGLDIVGGAETVYISRKRHVLSLKKTGSLIEESVVSLREGQALELVAENLRSAHFALGEITRPMSSDDLLGEIFSEFCIGK